MPGSKRIAQSQIALYAQLVDTGKVSIDWLARRGLVSRSRYFQRKAWNSEPRNSPGRRRKLSESVAALAQELILRRPDIYLDELQDLLLRVTGTRISRATIQRTLTRRGISRKRAHKIAQERDPTKRADYEARIGRYNPAQLVFVDETSFDARDTIRIHGRSKRNHKARIKNVYNRGQRFSCIAALSLRGGFAPYAVKGSFDEVRFVAYLRRELLPKMQAYPAAESVVVIDNASIHKSDAVRNVIEEFNCKLEYLSPYSPDFNPIERAFSKVKAYLRRINARRVDPNAFSDAIRAVTLQDCRSWFHLAGYV